MVADNQDFKLTLKAFHSEIINYHKSLKKEQENYQPIPEIRKLDNIIVQRNYLQIKQDVQDIIQAEMGRLLNDQGQKHLLIKKG
ncbi:hypothetical protein LV84_01754 [Algoriphagus ratkowskyi]|uniref:Uncharacterized protein n=1 Tax=Algoriphagus ratkowskyi TaxID=57028 RepID=A0A2W7RER9_9BACT|nr:hypothetical protein [Algoriphagus ratkowskyi]PZX57626.1 hypothetical protein LV84_01754 [Algoriphagus ratkowskyi]TXD78898.1 hypothetical protein ESW18_05105 [Algoriphagus ratkowskyi]